ncbi:YdcH family protein [Pseudoxanthomonas sp. Root65]|uniref:YdcH family protein n=1 Tax=Pseudoxanthomonas sp. Root65 TaxID=1736576 RepID=UPI0009EA949F|nr:YdcH family protein [Pseudoxanthomonas sp. Root65]
MTVWSGTVYARRVEIDNPADIAEKIAALRTEHRDLDDAIVRLVEDGDADEVAIKRLKKRKLWLKDCIARLESALIPDEPA